jgi:hypothetical protein
MGSGKLVVVLILALLQLLLVSPTGKLIIGRPYKYLGFLAGDSIAEDGGVMDNWLSWHAFVGLETLKSDADMDEHPSSGGDIPA